MNRLAMPATNSFRDLEVWQEAMLLVEDVYRLSCNFPADERFRPDRAAAQSGDFDSVEYRRRRPAHA